MGLSATGGMAAVDLCQAPEGTSLSRLLVVVADFAHESLSMFTYGSDISLF